MIHLVNALAVQVQDAASAVEETSATDAAVDWLELLGRMHPALVHLPIGMVCAVALIELFGFGEMPRRYVIMRRAALVVAMLSACTTATSGWFLGQPGDYDADILYWHRWLSIAVAVMLVLATLADLFSWHGFFRRLAVLLAVGLVVVTGHQGGSLTHGPNYLTHDAPAWMQQAVDAISPQTYLGTPDAGPEDAADEADEAGPSDAEQDAEPEPESTSDEAGASEARVVFDLLAVNCYRCHGPKKRKAGLRLDQREGLLSVIAAGAAPDSELFRRLSLPTGHGDEMPPSGPPMEEEDQARVRRWLNSGASFAGLELSGDAPQPADVGDAVEADATGG
ncbi:MAG: putative membrane protein/mono/diheme cytochrome c family protein [Planctomycetota bacterium]|jgi:uncharacterized membrane protein/mono/diheme cytochrome c family protein